jgi:glutamyl-tRNA synthetase
MSKIITRFPPSPTGFFHIGSARTALFNYLLAASAGGEMLLRFEDTDKQRSSKEFEKDILEGLAWLGIPFANRDAILHQSERTDVYKSHMRRLIENGAAYEAEAGTDDPSKKVVRFKNPNAAVTFSDLIRGAVTFNTTELKDFVIAKNTEEPLYHLAVVIDDAEMGVTHVVRGEDHISNTARQILILEALGFKRPNYAHIPLILAPDRSKLSKRHGAVSVNEYRKEGYLPQAFVNYLALLGWNPGTERELFTIDELAHAFRIEQLQKHGAIFDIEKLRWFNHEYMRMLDDREYSRLFSEFSQRSLPESAIALLKERARTFKEAADMVENGEFSFLDETIDYDGALLLKGAKTDSASAREHLTQIISFIRPLSGSPFNAGTIKEAVFPYATEKGRGAVLWPMRVALSGKERSPDPFAVAGLIGKERTLQRLDEAIRKLAGV